MSISTTIVFGFRALALPILVYGWVAHSSQYGCEEKVELTCEEDNIDGEGTHTYTKKTLKCEGGGKTFESGILTLDLDPAKCEVDVETDSHPSPCDHSKYTDSKGRTWELPIAEIAEAVTGLD